jgi:hypothetical protein
MPASLTTVNAITKEIYEPRIREQLQDEAVALKRIENSSDGVESQVGGKYVTFPVAGQQAYAAARISLRYQYGLARLSGQTMELVEKNYQAFASALDLEMTGLKNDLRKDLNRQVYGNGSGAVATAATAGTGNTFNASSAQWAQLGMQVDIVTGTTLGNANPTIIASNRQITAIDVDTNIITFNGAAQPTAVGDVIVRTGSVNREWAGLGAIIANSGIFQNVDPSVEPTWKSVVDANNGTNRPLSEGLMILMADKVRANGGSVTAMFSNLGVRRAYFNLLSQQRRYTNTQEFTGGFRGLAFTTDNGDIPFVVDTDCPPNRVYGINEKEITLYRESDWSFMDRDGSKWARVAGFDAYDATMYQYSNIGTHRRNTHFLLADIAEG